MRQSKPKQREDAEANTGGDAYNANGHAATDAKVAEVKRKLESVFPGYQAMFGCTTVDKAESGDGLMELEPILFRGLEALALMLRGVKSPAGDYLVPKCRITILLDGEIFKLAIQDQAGQRTAYKTLDESKELPDAILDALGGSFEWRGWNNAPKQKRS